MILALLNETALRQRCLRTLLDKDDDANKNADLGDHRTCPTFEQLAENTEAERRPNCTGQLPDAADDNDHEGINDIAPCPMSGPTLEICESATPPSPNDTCAKRKSHGIDTRRRHPDTNRPLPGSASPHGRTCQAVFLFISTQTKLSTKQRKANDDDAVPRQQQVGINSMPPDIQPGFETSTFCAPNKTRAD